MWPPLLAIVATMEMVAIVASVNNAPEPTAVVRATAAEGVLGAENILEHRTMAAEDMGFILQEIPGCYFSSAAATAARPPTTRIIIRSLTSTSGQWSTAWRSWPRRRRGVVMD